MPRQDMRLIEVMLLSAGARDDVLDVLEVEGLDYNVSDRTDNAHASGLVSFPIPSPRVEAIQERLEGLDSGGETYTIVYDPEAVVSSRYGTANTAVDEDGALSPDRISRRELHSKAAELLPDALIYRRSRPSASGLDPEAVHTLLTGVSAVVMIAGVLLEVCRC
jgi:hypothetical protein